MSHRETSSSSESDRGEGPSRSGPGTSGMDVTRKSALTAKLEVQRRYEQTPEAKKVREAYRQSPGGAAAVKKYRQTPKYIATAKAYRESDNGKETIKRSHEARKLDRIATQDYKQRRPFSEEEEKNIKRSVRVQDQPPGQEGVLLPEGKSLQYKYPNTVRRSLQTLNREGRLDPGEEKVQMMGRELGEVSSESEDSRDRGYNEPPPEMRK